MPHAKSFLKWPGGKYRLLPYLLPRLPEGARLVEPFAGSGVVSLNAPFRRCLLCDANADLICLFTVLRHDKEDFITRCRKLFTPDANTAACYYQRREQFNASRDAGERSALFLYLNRHGYNGLVRYNSSGAFNVPFGRYKNPYFPERELYTVLPLLTGRKLSLQRKDFRATFAHLRKGDVVYCDPPYVPLSSTASFTSYAEGGFSMQDQEVLAQLARETARQGIPVLISNHNTPVTRKLYHDARLEFLDVRRSISCNGAQRGCAPEILAIFS